MKAFSRRSVIRIALPTAAALGAGAAVGVAAIPDATNTIHGCFDANGALRVIDAPTQACAAGETALDWNQRGPAGPAGPQGDPGPAGFSPSSPTTSDSTTTTTPDTFQTPTQAGGPSADIFLKVDGIPGDSTDDKHQNEIDVTSVAFALGRGGDGTGSAGVAPATPTTTTTTTTTTKPPTGAAARRLPLRTLRVDKLYDAASPRLMQAAGTGQRIKTAVLTFRRTSDTDVEFLTYTLTDVQVTSYDQGGKDGDDRDLGSLEEEIGLTAARVRVTERPVGPDGKPGAAVNASVTPRRGG
jgi:type VI secretion system secreted protein Hcp